MEQDTNVKEKSRYDNSFEKLALDGVSLKNARVLPLEGGYYLESFFTVVAGITADKWFFVLGLYSTDTSKHIEAFVNQYTNLEFSFVKELYRNNQCINLETGETKDMYEG